MKQFRRIGMWSACALLASAPAFSQTTTYRCTDENGRSTYTNVAEVILDKKCVVVIPELSLAPVPPPPVQVEPKPPASSPVPAAKAKPRIQGVRHDRRKILQSELGLEEKALAEARHKLAAQEKSPPGSESTQQRVLDRVKSYQDDVQRQEQNVAELRKEISTLK
ncbi:MAG: DUF4124 domain-containing protein [Betaproteobacteria bacterium]|nr:DUF4124 domain-containing protein [Betaproteobacteria bacterium]